MVRVIETDVPWGVRLRRRLRRRPLLVAVFSFRYDAPLVPALKENLGPIVDGWISYDDRGSTDYFSDEPSRRQALIQKAREVGASWVLAMDPDERLEIGAAEKIRSVITNEVPAIWLFDLRELYTPLKYRIDGVWGKKKQARLFPIEDGQVFSERALHGPWYPIQPEYPFRRIKLNLFHLKMINARRRQARRDMYKELDPESQFQRIGYDYLGDDTDAVLRAIPSHRRYYPKHVDDGGLWMADRRSISAPSSRACLAR